MKNFNMPTVGGVVWWLKSCTESVERLSAQLECAHRSGNFRHRTGFVSADLTSWIIDLKINFELK